MKKQEQFRNRLTAEYQTYRASVLSCSNAEIYGKCYEIDIMINLYEILMEMSDKLSDSVLESLLSYGNILSWLYDLWLREDDSFYSELSGLVESEIKKITEARRT